jgi:type I restriction enzyme S subunit
MSTATLDTTTVRRWKRYPEYRPSGAVWLPQVPGHWGAKRLKYLATPSRHRLFEKPNDTTYIGLEQIESRTGKLLLDNPVETVESNMGVFDRGDVLFGKLRPYLAKVASPTFAGVCTTEVTVYRPRPEVHGDYLKYQLLTSEFIDFINTMAYGTKMPRVSEEQLGEARLALPPLPEQRAIAAFLDRETARIDALIGHKERLIALLEEKRQAVISHAVTRGLDPGVRLKDSGIPWLGMVPQHWTIKKLKYSVRFLNYRRIPLSAEERGGLEKIHPYYGASGIIDHVDRYIFDEPLILIGEDGANLLSRSTPLAFIATGKYWVNNHAHILKPASGQLLYWTERLNSISYVPFVSGSAQPKLTIESLGSIEFAAPEADEQAKIAAFISDQDAKMAPIIARVRDGIARLQEYRTALISAAVTGQIDVRGEVE